MKKIFSIFILAVAGILAAQASQTFTVTSVNNSQTIYFRISKTSGSVTRSKTTNYGSAGTVSLTENDTYWQTFAVTTGSNTYKTLTITLPDDVTYVEVYNNKANVAAMDVSGMATYLTSLNLSGCSNLTSLTLGTMSALTDIDVSNTRAAVANAITAAKCPALENLNVANCGLTSLAYTGTTLYALDVTGNNIFNLDLSGNTNLDIVRCESNDMFSLVVPKAVTTISAQSNQLEDLDGYGESIQVLDVASNGLSAISLDVARGLTDLDISSNHLTFRSFPSAENKPSRMLYTGNDGQYDLSDQMRAAFGSYSYPLQSMMANYSARSNSDYTLDLSESLLDGHNTKSVMAVPNRYDGTTYTALSQSNSSVDDGDYAVDGEKGYYGFLKPQSRVRIKFTHDAYPDIAFYSKDFTVPSGITGTIKIVDEEGTELYTKSDAVFSDAVDGLPVDARREYTQYTYSAVPTTPGATWTVIARPSDDAPFVWAKDYNSAVWYYMSLGTGTNKWVTAGESNGSAGTPYGGHALKSSYSTTDNNYQWAFVGNQYDGFKIYNKGCGNGQTLQDYSGYMTPTSGGMYPIMRSGTSLTWIVRTNSSGEGFSLQNKTGGMDGGVSAPCYLNNYGALGYLNYWITKDNDAQNDAGSRFTVEFAANPISPVVVKWTMVNSSGTAVYTFEQNVAMGNVISDYPSELKTMAANRYVTLPNVEAFTISSGTTVKRVEYTWNGLFNISDVNTVHYYNLGFMEYLGYFDAGNPDCFVDLLSATTGSDNALTMVKNADGMDAQYQWAFYGDPFNGFTIKNRSTGKTLYHNNALSNGGVPVLSENDATAWTILASTYDGANAPSNNEGMKTAYESAITISCGSFFLMNYGFGKLLKFYNNSQGDRLAGVKLTLVESIEISKTITWRVKNGETVLYEEQKAYNKGETVSEYPADLIAWAESVADRFVSLPTLTPFTVTENGTKELSYVWTGPFTLTTDVNNPNLYYFKSARYGYYAYAPTASDGSAKQASQKKNVVTPRGRWFFTGDPFNGIEIRPYAHPETGLVNNTLSTTPTKYIPRTAPDITTNYWDNALPSAAISFIIPNSSNCLAEQLGTWSAASVGTDKGLSFVVEEAEDVSMLVEPGFYRVRCMGSGLTTKYWKLDSSDHKLYNNGDTENMNTIFRIEENVNADNNLPESYYIAGFDGDQAWYMDNTQTTYSQQFTATQTAADYMPAQIIYNAKSGDIPYYAIKLATFSENDHMSYANTNGNQTTVVGWSKTAGTADGSAWTFEPVAVAPTATDIYTINNGYAYRGALMSAPLQSEKWVWDSGKNSQTYDATSANCQWIFVPTGTADQYYLYNVGKQKFVVPTKSGGWSAGSNYTWMFSSDAVPLQLVQQDNGTYKMSSVSGDIYLSISNNNTGPIINYNDNGAKFMITKRGTASSEVSAQLEAALAAKPGATKEMALNALNGKSYATLYLDYDVQTDENTKAYYILNADNGIAIATEVANGGREIPAYTAVVLVNENAATSPTFSNGFAVSSGYAEAIAEGSNLLKGTLVDIPTVDGAYVFSGAGGVAGFYRYSGATLAANKAYLLLPNSQAKGFILDFSGETNSISLTPDPSPKGEGSDVYDLSGRKVKSTLPDSQSPRLLRKGIYIVNGRKVVIK